MTPGLPPPLGADPFAVGPRIPAEIELLLMVAAPTVLPHWRPRARSLLARPGIDARLVDVARSHRMATAVHARLAPLVAPAHELSGAANGGSPRPSMGAVAVADATARVRAALADARRRQLARDVELQVEAARVVRALEEATVPVIVLKGVAVAHALYAAPELRPPGDIDLLVRPSQASRARRLLEGRGYRADCPAMAPTSQELARHMRTHTQVELLRGARFGVDLHWGFSGQAGRAALDREDVWARTESVHVHDRRFRTLGASDLLIHLCEHAGRSLYARPTWLGDISRLLAHPSFDAADAWARACETGARRSVLLGLELARRFQGSSVDRAFPLGDAYGSVLDRLVLRVLETWCAFDVSETFDLQHALRLQDRPSDRIGLALQLALRLTPNDWAGVDRPAPWRWAARLRRVAARSRLKHWVAQLKPPPSG